MIAMTDDAKPEHVPENPKTVEAEKPPIPDEFKKKQKEFKWKARLWSQLYYVLGVSSVVLGALVASPSALTNLNVGQETLGTAIAMITALTTLLSPSARAKKYNSARLVLHSARDAYEIENDPIREALSKARTLIEQE